MRNRRRVMVTAVTAVIVWLAVGQVGWTAGGSATGVSAGGATGTGLRVNPGVDLTPELALDEQTLAKATERGEVMLKKAQWSVAIEGLISDSVTLYDAGDYVICTPASNWELSATVVEKATGKQVLPADGVRILSVTDDKGGAMLVRQSTGRVRKFESRPLGSETIPIDKISLRGLAEGTSRWEVEMPLCGDSALIAGKQVFTGAGVPGMKPIPLPPFASALHPTSTRLALEIASFELDSGKKQWSYSLPENTLEATPSVCANGVLYVLATPGESAAPMLLALNAADGSLLFNIRLEIKPREPGGRTLQERLSNVAVTDGAVVAASGSGELVGFDAKTGQQKWREPIALSKEPGKVTLAELSYLSAEAPVVAGDRILVRAEGRTKPPSTEETDFSPDNSMAGLAAFDAKTHKQVWFFRPPEDTAEWRPDGTLRKQARQLSLLGMQVEKEEIVALAIGSRAAIVGINLKSGKLEWLLPTMKETPRGPFTGWKPLVSGGVVYLVKDSKLLAVPLP